MNLLKFLLVLFSCIILRDYLQWQSLNFCLGLPAMFLLLQSSPSSYIPYRYLFPALFFLIVTCFIPLNTLFYFGVVCSLLYLVELNFKGRGSLVFLTAALLSPVAQYLFNVFSFPIRVWLTQTAVTILRFSENDLHAQGNLILWKGQEFSVDLACMGLNLTVASLLTGVIVLALFQIRSQKKLSFPFNVSFLFMVFTFNILSNLIRILVLVKFSIFPDQPMHDITGLVCLLAYVLLPSWGLAFILFKYFGKNTSPKDRVMVPQKQINKILTIGLFVLVGWAGLRLETKNSHQQEFSGSQKLITGFSGYQASCVFSDVVKLQSAQSLIYLKPIPDFFSAEHSPLICWKGNGYQLEKISEIKLAGQRVYKAVLVQGTRQLHTVWWFYNGIKSTTSQFEWRWDSLQGAPSYYLINLTTAEEKDLLPALESLLHNPGYRNLQSNHSLHETTESGR